MFKSLANKSKEKKKKCDTGKETERNKNLFSESCAIHPQRKLDLFCSKCDKVYCRDCRDTGSRECHKYHKLAYISDVAYVFENSKEFKEYDTNILALRRKLERSIEKTTENMKLSTQLQEEAENTIKQQKETLTELIETHYRKISKRNKKVNEDCLNKLTEILEQSKGLKAQFEDIENEINEKRNLKMTTLFIAIKKSKEEIKRTEEEIRRLNERSNVTRYVFEAGEQALTFMKNMEDFGDLVEENLNSGEKDNTFTTFGPFDSTLDDNRSSKFLLVVIYLRKD
ncbi:tripartite motif-containing protein 66-like [Mercenaria mercenaria]|uniref:tripartite motif-containing protein 66-like n=1 Tax=Mercenaria mercenaria TaxID=6596 RepID=UPI00234EB122|nr:tripartite motif-containing protein 66-like [Mercenaria mercenaria]